MDRSDFPPMTKIDKAVLVTDGLQPSLENCLRDALPRLLGLGAIVVLGNACSELVYTGQRPLAQYLVLCQTGGHDDILIETGVYTMPT